MPEIKIKGNTQIRERTITQALHKAYMGHTVEVLNAFVVGTHPGSSNPITTPNYGETVLCTSDGTWNGVGVTNGHYYQWQDSGGATWVDVGTRADGDKVLVAAGSPISNAAIGDFAGQENDLAIWDDGNATWNFVTPDDGEAWQAYVQGDGFWNQMLVEWAYIGSLTAWSWTPVSRWLSKIDGNGLTMVGPSGALSSSNPDDNQLAIEVDSAEDDLVVDSGGLHHEDKLAHVVRVAISNIVDDQNLQPDGGEVAGDVEQVNVSGSPAGAWSTFGNGDIVEYDGQSWTVIMQYANLASGTKARIGSGVDVGATFGSQPNKIMEWNGSNWTDNGFYDPADGTQCIQEGSDLSQYENDTYVWDNIADTWVEVSSSVSVDGNALQESSGVISHVDSIGHTAEKVDYANISSDARQAGNDPSAAAYPGETWIVNNWSSFTDGEVAYSDGSSWTSVSGSQPSALVQAGTRITTASSVQGDLTADSIQEVTAIDWVNGNTYETFTPTEGDAVLVASAPAGTEITSDENLFQIWNGTTWDLAARPPSGLAGSGLSVDTYDQLEVNLTSTEAGLQITSDELHVVGVDANGNTVTANATDKRVVLDDRLQSFINGLNWRDPVGLLRVISDANGSGSPPAGPSAGDAYVCNNWSSVNTGSATGTLTAASKELSDSVYTFVAGDVGDFIVITSGNNIGVHEITSINAGAAVLGNSTIVDESNVTWRQSDTYKDGSIYEFDGNAWVEIVEGVDVEPPDGTRVIVNWNGSPSAAGSFNGEDGNIAVYDAGNSQWDFTDPEDTWAVFVGGSDAEGSYYENTQWVCDTGTGSPIWTQVGAQTTYTGSTGIDITGTAISIDTDRASGTPASGTTWSSGITGLNVADVICILNGKVLEHESVIGNLEAGEFNYASGTGVVTVSAADTFDGQNDFISIWGFKS